MYYALALALIAALLFVTTSKRFTKARKEKAHMFDVMVGVVCTAVGVFLGTQVARIEAAHGEHERAIALLERAKIDVGNCAEDLRRTYWQCQLRGRDSVVVWMALDVSPLQAPLGLETALQSEAVLNGLSSKAYEELRNVSVEVENFVGVINGLKEANSVVATDVLEAGKAVFMAKHDLDLQVEVMNGKISEGEREERRNRWALSEAQGTTAAGSWGALRSQPVGPLHGSLVIGGDTIRPNFPVLVDKPNGQ